MNLTKKSLISFIKSLFFLIKIEGESAWPNLIPEKVYLATGIAKAKKGDFIVFISPKNKKQAMVKKVTEIQQDSYLVEGSVPWATSSQELGPIPKSLVLGKIIRLRLNFSNNNF